MRCFLILFFLTIFLVYISCEQSNNTTITWNYCEHPDCSLKNQHTLCIASNKQSPRLIASGMTPWMRYQMLLLHNRHRDNIALGMEAGQPPATNMRKMYWDYELEQMAEVWARQCQKRHDECRNTIRFNVIQNMDVRPVVPRVTEAQLLSDTVGAWFSGARVLPPENVWSFRPSNCSSERGCNSHWYSAAAWGSTWRLGCSQSLCTSKRSACSIYRKKRRAIPFYRKVGNKTESGSENLLLPRENFMTANNIQDSGDDSTRDTELPIKSDSTRSPLHRGMRDPNEKPEALNIIAFTFCNYGPAGNIDGFPIYDAGTACTNCPPDTRCGDKSHRGLCALNEDPDIRRS